MTTEFDHYDVVPANVAADIDKTDTLIIMTTTKKRINISVSKELDEMLGKLAARDQVPQATKTEHLLRIALELEEDQILNDMAEKRDVRRSKPR